MELPKTLLPQVLYLNLEGVQVTYFGESTPFNIWKEEPSFFFLFFFSLFRRGAIGPLMMWHPSIG